MMDNMYIISLLFMLSSFDPLLRVASFKSIVCSSFRTALNDAAITNQWHLAHEMSGKSMENLLITK